MSVTYQSLPPCENRQPIVGSYSIRCGECLGCEAKRYRLLLEEIAALDFFDIVKDLPDRARLALERIASGSARPATEQSHAFARPCVGKD